MEFAYRLTGAGWAEARLSDGSSWVTLTASYLSDALGDLLEAVGLLLEGAGQAHCSWAGEPGECRWLFECTHPDVRLRVLAFRDRRTAEPDEGGTVVFDARTSIRQLAEAIVVGAQNVLDEYGEDEYRRRWIEHPFPSRHLEHIRTHLAR